MKPFFFLAIVLCLIMTSFQKQAKTSDILYQSERFTVFKDKVVQGKNVAEVISPIHIKSNYKSPASKTFSRLIKFKFSINEKDNELPPGKDHWLIIGEEHESQIVSFGKSPAPSPESPNTFLPTNYEYTFKVDMSPVLKQFEEKGYYETFNGIKISKADFKGFYIAGGSEPLTWDFVGLEGHNLKLHPTSDPNIYSITLKLNPYDPNDYKNKEWKLSGDISAYPKFTSNLPIVDALFNLSEEEGAKNIEADGTLRTGAKWGGVWTRDVSYSTLLAFAYHVPEAAKTSLQKKVRRNRIVQDTGSGGAWPISSDRTTWVLAAWEIYKVTGDKAWLDEIYPIIKNTLEDDYKTIYDKNTGMFSGESSFLDWREQSYPKWMDNKDIYTSENLGTNVVHYQAHRILAEIAKIKGEPYKKYEDQAEHIKEGINKYLWLKDKNYYAQYLYGRNNLIASPRFEALGEALSVIFDVADETRARSILAHSPVTEFGATCFYPHIPNIPSYHNNAIWPYVQSYWNWAAAKTGNGAVLSHGLASIYRAGALFLTNYENMVAENGDFLGTEINSNRMLWSIAGNLAMVYRVFMGMQFETDGLYFHPVVPEAYKGKKTLSNFKYRKAILSISVIGFGNKIKSVSIDGKIRQNAFIPADSKGKHEIIIHLTNEALPYQSINKVENHFSLTTIQAKKNGDKLIWQAVKGAQKYRIYKNGKFERTTNETQLKVDSEEYVSYQISAVDDKGFEGFASEPQVFVKNTQIVEIENFAEASKLPYTNFSGKGFVELSLEKNRNITLSVKVDSEGTYLLDFRYANGSGPWNTDNKCGIRSLAVNGKYEGVIVLPQRGKNEWSDWGFSNARKVHLKKGENTVQISFEDWNYNMNVGVNTAMLDYLRITKISE